MSNLGRLFGRGLPGNWVKDPRHLPLWDGTSSLSLNPAGPINNPNEVAFWDAIASVGAIKTTNTGSVYGTIVNVTGRGLLFHVLPPCMTATTNAATFKITVDGVEYEFGRTGGWNSVSVGGRVVLGSANPGVGTDFSADNAYAFNFANISPGGTDRLRATQLKLLPPQKIWQFSHPCLYFETSLKVEAKVTSISVGGSYTQYSGATYMLF